MYIRIFFQKQRITLIFLVLFLLSSCSYKSGGSDIRYTDDDIEDEYYEDESREIDDGTYSADVEYYNPYTGYNCNYTLDVEVQDGHVVEIDFSNGGYLDDSHIDPTELDEDGNCTVYDDKGREFEIHIDY